MSSSSSASAPLDKPRTVVKKLLAESQPEGQGGRAPPSAGASAGMSSGTWTPSSCSTSSQVGLGLFLMRAQMVLHQILEPCLQPTLPLNPCLVLAVSKPAGFPDHPHRGFETVTYMLEGAFTHQDFAGHKGTIRAGDVQWMTAGRGSVHSEMPAGDGVHKGLQLWINLSSKDKMVEPRYQELQSKDISRAEQGGVEARIIAGEAFGVRSPVFTRTPTMYIDFTKRPGSQLHQPIPEPEGWNAFVYIIAGEGVFGREKAAPVSAHHCIVLGPSDGLSVWNKSGAPLRFALVAGQPLGEPVVQHGPFVMNSRAEIQQAMEDYYYGKNGFERASQWSSSA
ncbi:unnamed protein product [Urochloa humidicola]